MTSTSAAKAPPAAATTAAAVAPPRESPAFAPARRFISEELFAGRHEIEILHGDACYRMRRTSNGKLILTK